MIPKAKHTRLLIASAALLAAGAALWYYKASGKRDEHSIAAMAANPYNLHIIDSCEALLQNGDIVVRTGNDMTSEMFREANRKDKTYSHCGIVLVEDGKPYIYHSIGGEDNPDEVLRRDNIQAWASPLHNSGIGILRYHFTPAQVDSLVRITRSYYSQHKKFDMQFDISNDDELYCAELLYQAINKSLGKAVIQPTKWMGYTYVAVDDITHNNYCEWICQVRYK